MASSILPDNIFSLLPISSFTKKIWIGYSGGVDSHVLLHIISQAQLPLGVTISAIYINHGLNVLSEYWAMHCNSVCTDLGIEFTQVTIDATAPKGESQEAWSRKLRYQAFCDKIGKDDLLLTAHHKDDTAETLLLQLFRGAGPAGLAAMPLICDLGNGKHCRPLLYYDRRDLIAWAKINNLSWIEDDSNRDKKFDRNYLRYDILPGIKNRWPGISQTLSRSARIQADTNNLINELASIDLEKCFNKSNNTLSISGLRLLSVNRIANAIRFWIKHQGYPTPSYAQLTRVIEDIIYAKKEAEPCVSWNGVRVRRYRDHIFLTPPLPKRGLLQTEIKWDLAKECKLTLGNLNVRRGRGNGIKAEKCPENKVTIKFRCGSEKIKKRGHHHKLKKLYQESGVPSCFRDYIPLIFIENKLVAIAGLHIDDDFEASADEDAIQIHWSSSCDVYSLSNA
jgi:tRNA(Ile)-lysidine synthase